MIMFNIYQKQSLLMVNIKLTIFTSLPWEIYKLTNNGKSSVFTTGHSTVYCT